MRATIDESAHEFTFLNTFHVTPGQTRAVVESLRRFTEDTARHLEGFISTSVHVSLDGSRVVNYVQWRSAEHLAAMLELPQARAHLEEVRTLTEAIDPMSYQVSFVCSAAEG